MLAIIFFCINIISLSTKTKVSAFVDLKTLASCPHKEDVISVSDIQTAFRAASLAYNATQLGEEIPITEGFTVTYIAKANLPHDGGSIMAILAEKGYSTIVAFRATDTNRQLLKDALSSIKNKTEAKEFVIDTVKEDINIGEDLHGPEGTTIEDLHDKESTLVDDILHKDSKVNIDLHGKVIHTKNSNIKFKLQRKNVSPRGMIRGRVFVVIGGIIKVNEIFLDAFNLIFPSIKKRLIDQSRRYILTGYSLGGALASMTALKMAQDGRMWENPQSCLITFGQPRVGNRAYAHKHDERIPSFRKLRFVLHNDPVPHIPLWPDYVHHSSEVFMDEEDGDRPNPLFWGNLYMQRRYWRICNDMEDPGCSDRNSFLPELEDHELEAYKKYILNLPEVYKDKNKRNKLTFQEALTSSCVQEVHW